jgi:penicillin-binding protein 2
MEPVITREAPKAGHDIHLSIDMDVQRILIRALGSYESGAAVVIDPRDGTLRGIISKPSFDPNAWSGRLTAEGKRAIDENPFLPMLDKSVHAFFPGSVYKIVTALGGLEEGILDPALEVESPGSYTFGDRVFHCHKRAGHGAIDLDDAMAASADVYFYQLGEKLGIEVLAHYGRALGFGAKPGLAINGESAGLVPTRAHHHEKTKGGFQQGFALSTAVGQGDVRASPLQVALAYGAFANGGTLYGPRIVETVRDRAGTVLTSNSPRQVARVPGAETQVPIINRALERVVNDPKRGTGTLAAVRGITIAGKTGTAQVREIVRGRGRQTIKRFRDRDHAWFAAFAPYEAPRLVVVVFLEHGGSGGRNAAPVAREIMEAYHESVEPLLPTAPATSQPSDTLEGP